MSVMMKNIDWLRGGARTLLTALSLAACVGAAQAGPYPDQPIKLVVGFPPGGGGDLYGRTIAAALTKTIGQNVIVDNRPGAGGNIAAELVARAKPDGYTLILAMSGNFGTAPAMRSNLQYKVPGDFAPIALLVETPFGLMVGSKSPIKTVAEYVQAAKGGKMTFASTGAGGAAHIVMEMVKQHTGLDILHVAYKGSGPALTDLYGGQVGSFFAPYTPLMGQINGGKLRLLAVSSAQRVPSMSQIPTLKESGIDVVMTQWYGLAAPAGTPKEVVDKLTRAVGEAMKDPEALAVFRADGAQEGKLVGDAFRSFIVEDVARYRKAVERGNLKVD